MFSTPLSSPPATSHHVPTVSRRNSRLRGLGFLRNYAHTHLPSREPNSSTASASASATATATTSTETASHRSSRVISFRPRSASFSTSANPTSAPNNDLTTNSANLLLTTTTSTPTSTSDSPPLRRNQSSRGPRSNNRLSAITVPGFSPASASQTSASAPASPDDPTSSSNNNTTSTSSSDSLPSRSRRVLRSRSLRTRNNRLSTITIPGFSSFSHSSLSSSDSPSNSRSDSPPLALVTTAVDPPPQAPVEAANVTEAAATVSAPANAITTSTTTHPPTTTATTTTTHSSPLHMNTTSDVEDATMLPGRENGTAIPPDTHPSIRFSAYYDARAARPSLSFQPVSRTLPSGTEVIKVGRYSERDAQPQVPSNVPSAAPVGFKSKVVSRRHCEFWFEDGKWHVKDVKSSSGTFLNHIRLSAPGTESKPYVVNDGDIIQLGIDFKGGEEMIFRCVKMRLELNRGWQNKLNTFNMSTHKQLRSLVANGAGGSAQDCSICLNAIAPCQSLFVAPCSHTWHYKCIRLLLNSPQYPIFVCPNCRAAADLEAEVDEPCEEWQQVTSEESAHEETKSDVNSEVQADSAAGPSNTQEPAVDSDSADAADMTMQADLATPSPPSAQPPSMPERIQHTMSHPVPIPPVVSPASHLGCASQTRTSSPGSGVGVGSEGPITPRNNAGPWVFDGSAGAIHGSPLSLPAALPIRSLDSAALDTATRP